MHELTKQMGRLGILLAERKIKQYEDKIRELPEPLIHGDVADNRLILYNGPIDIKDLTWSYELINSEEYFKELSKKYSKRVTYKQTPIGSIVTIDLDGGTMEWDGIGDRSEEDQYIAHVKKEESVEISLPSKYIQLVKFIENNDRSMLRRVPLLRINYQYIIEDIGEIHMERYISIETTVRKYIYELTDNCIKYIVTYDGAIQKYVEFYEKYK